MKPRKTVWTITEAAAELGVNARTLRRWAEAMDIGDQVNARLRLLVKG